MRADTYKIVHWMNVRKVTTGQVAEAVGRALDPGEAETWPSDLVSEVADFLRVDAQQLVSSGRRDLTALTRSAADLRATRRPIQRDGIHFYNYYTMAAPPGAVAPVILDILCPAERVPALNNGHLEPAITVNIGPGDINGRWGEALTEATWQVLHANPAARPHRPGGGNGSGGGEDAWIVGDSYVEPSCCPHSYSLATGEPARIISYTGQSNLAGLLEDLNDWSEPAAGALLDRLEAWGDTTASAPGAGTSPYGIAELLLARRGHTIPSAARSIGVSEPALREALGEGGLDTLRDLGRTLGFDYRLLLAPQYRHDSVGKTYRGIDECRADARDFRGYRVSSLASAPHLPDLTGLFMRVDGDAGEDLSDPAETHYLVTGGEVELEWTDADGGRGRSRLGVDGTAWIAPFVAHRWSGTGSLVRLGSGRHLSYLDLTELANTYAAAATLRRGRRDDRGWGYDS
jgi:hypothetical protein